MTEEELHSFELLALEANYNVGNKAALYETLAVCLNRYRYSKSFSTVPDWAIAECLKLIRSIIDESEPCYSKELSDWSKDYLQLQKDLGRYYVVKTLRKHKPKRGHTPELNENFLHIYNPGFSKKDAFIAASEILKRHKNDFVGPDMVEASYKKVVKLKRTKPAYNRSYEFLSVGKRFGLEFEDYFYWWKDIPYSKSGVIRGNY